MTSKEALEYLKPFKWLSTTTNVYEALEQLVERDTPMKPISSGNTSSISKHCICDKVVMPYDRFCPKCGQRLDWEEEDE